MSRKPRRGKRKAPAPPAPAVAPLPSAVPACWDALLARLPWRPRTHGQPGLSREEALNLVPCRNPQLRWDERGPDQNTGHLVPVVVLRVPRRQDGWPGLLNRFVAGPETREVILDELGTDVWQLCDGAASVEQIIRELARRHRLGRREVELSLTAYLRILAKRGYIQLKAPGPDAGSGRTEIS